MLHSVGCPQPSAKVFVGQWNKPGVQVAVHGAIEPSGDVYQCMPWNYRGWHGASGSKGSANDTHIGFEMTEPATIKYKGGASFTDSDPVKSKAHVVGTYNTAVELFAHLCVMYKLDPLQDGVVISHAEGHERGIASNHGDPDHLFAKYGLSMNQFRQDVKAAMAGARATPPPISVPTPNVTPPVQSSTPYTVKVLCVLNIRQGPGTNHSIQHAIKDNGVYTIVEEADGEGAKKWGKLKSGAGWIALDFTEKV